ncbi:MAG: hypothetical protein INR65_02570, partial [Gluconacetobacter diazotrophicus]|nr:hypothetical protein [Gluconacetobacter diazotrophicus]
MGALPSFAPALTAAFQTVLEASWQGSLVIGLVLLVRRALGGRVPARWRHALWWLVLARLLVPAFALPRNPASLQNVAALGHPFAEVRNLVEAAAPGYPLPDALLPPAPVVPPQGSSDEAADAPGPGSSAVASRPFHPSVWTMLAGGWLAGTSGFTVWVLVAMLRWRARLRRDPACTNPAVERLWRTCCARAGLRRPPALQATALVNSPALLGWW